MNAPFSHDASARSVSSAQLKGAQQSESFKAAMRHLVGGVSIVSVALGEERGGLVATSVTSLSNEPPSLIVCIRQSASVMPLLREAGRFGVSILAQDHREIADRFAGRDGSKGASRFAGADWIHELDQSPVLTNALASFECEVADMIDQFSHTIVIGRVTKSRATGGDGALVYWRAAYETVGVTA